MPDTHARVSESLPVIDLSAFTTLASVLGQQRMARMATNFFADADGRLEQLERAGATPPELQEHAHALISMAGHLGLKRLSTLCMTLQERARANGGLDELPALRTAVTSARAAVEAVLTVDAPSPSEPQVSDRELSRTQVMANDRAAVRLVD